MSSVQVLLSIKDESLRRKAVDALRESSNNVSFEQHDSDWTSLLERLVKVKPEALLLDVGSVPTDLAIAIRQVKLQAPRTKIVALHAVDDPKIILAAMRAGANEFLHPPFEESLTLALDRILNSTDVDVAPASRGKIIGFLSAKGGCGSTTLACHIAWELQNQTRKNVLLADLDLTSGLVGFL